MNAVTARPLCVLVLFTTALCLFAGPTRAAPRRGDAKEKPAIERPDTPSLKPSRLDKPSPESKPSRPEKPDPAPPPLPPTAPPPSAPPPTAPPPTAPLPPVNDSPGKPDRDDRRFETRGEPQESRRGRGRETESHPGSDGGDPYDRDPYDRDSRDHGKKGWVPHDHITCCGVYDPEISSMVGVDEPLDLTALDLDVVPRKALVYVNGALQGKSRAYDGFPSYLWLERGTWDLVFYRPGYQTVARRYVIRGDGKIVRIKVFMLKGETMSPESLLPAVFEHNTHHL